MLARVRVSVPDRPGSLGRATSAVGAAGADIVAVEVLESEAGRALDDVHVHVRDVAQLDDVCVALTAVPGVAVVGVQHPVPPVTGHSELELVAQVLARPERGLQTLVDGAPAAVGADWGAAISYDDWGTATAVAATSAGCPGLHAVPLTTPMRVATPRWPPFAGVAVVPLRGAQVALAVVRERGLAFHRSELWRLEQVGRIVGSALRSPAVSR
jgi:hypothetical protein